jgi:hypothetical protein
LIALISFLVAEFALFLFVIGKLALMHLGRNAGSAQKLAFIKVSWRRAFGKA